MPAVGVEVKGAKELARALKRAGVQVRDMKDANQAVGNVVVRASVPLTPRRTGALAGSIRASREQSAATVRAGGGRVRYAAYVEYGTSRMGARPFLATGMATSEPVWLDVYDRELQRLMDQVAGAT